MLLYVSEVNGFAIERPHQNLKCNSTEFVIFLRVHYYCDRASSHQDILETTKYFKKSKLQF